MTENSSRRGRPKGSGIDDIEHLHRIAALIADNPDMKPTTAIKAIGITDPSIIRRLRDKFHDFATSTADHSPTPARSGASLPTAALAQPAGAPARIMAAGIENATLARRSEPAAVPVVPASVSAAPGPAHPSANAFGDPFTVVLGWGISAWATAMSAQVSMAQGWVHLPHVSLALRQQVAMSELVLSLSPVRRGLRPNLLH